MYICIFITFYSQTSHEVGDSSSVTSGVENEIKKTSAVFGKMKRNSIKKKNPNFGQESDVTVTEPLLQTEKEGTDYVDQSANEIISQPKTEINKKNYKDDIIMPENKAIVSDIPRSVQTINENVTYKTQPSTTGFMHNHMNTNIFNSLDKSTNTFTSKNQILVDIDGCRQVSYSSNPLIFTTAKIHSDGKNKHMEPVQVTPVPILSTVEVSVSRAGKCGEASSNIVQAITSICSTQCDRDSKNIVTFPTRPASMQLKDIPSKSVTNATTQGNILNKINVTNTITMDYTKAIKTTESDLPKSSNMTNNEGNILLSTKQVSNTGLKDESNLNVMKSPIVHSTVTEPSSTNTKLTSTFIKDNNQQIESTKQILKSLDIVGSKPSQQKNNQAATISSSIKVNNKKEATNSSVTHKLLPRQKNTITENELNLQPNYIESGNSDNGNSIKSSKDCYTKTNSPIKPNFAERDSSSRSHEILPRTSSTRNLGSNISKPPKTTAITETTMDSTSITSSKKPLLSTVPSYTPTTTLRITTTKTTTTTNITSSDQNMKRSSITKPPVNTIGSPLTEITYSNKPKITKPSVTSTPISSVNVSPVVSSVSQNVTNVQSCPTSNTVKTICLPSTAVKSATPTTTPLNISKLSTSKFSSASLSSDKQMGHVNNTGIKSTTNNITEGQSKLSMTTGTNGTKPKQKDLSKDDKGVKS